MVRIRYRTRHDLARDEARRRLGGLMQRFGGKYGFRTSWSSERSVDVKGRGVNGAMRIGDGEVRIDLELSRLLAPFRSRIEGGIAGQIEQALREPPEEAGPRGKPG